MILALDLGRFVGVAVGRVGERPILSSREFPLDIGALGNAFSGFVWGLIREHKPTRLAWERPFLNFARMDAQGELRTQRLYGEAFALETIANQCGITTFSERPQTVRKRVIGAGNAKEDQILAFAHKAGLSPSNNHEADAYVVWCAAGGRRVEPGRSAKARNEGVRRRA